METQRDIRTGVVRLAQKYERASLLTLSASRDNPRTVMEPWEKFKAWLAAKNGGTVPDLVAAHEFSSTGHQYLHVLVAMPWIADRRDITNAAIECGFGPINSVYGVDSKDDGYVFRGKQFYGMPSNRLVDMFTDLIPGVA